ncbi:hypothetical protein DY218_17165 [Streptomyces triticagri]|uniref:DUF6458 domain-containing protein n=1 Tax=Streptomyces triticagri TaxID=2293568 RepID=A0A372M4P8_9ACTN|nr:DUF6458 family protein [Streptomyces triticagri]RFU85505.1 hypothetical protein DY218_17165 [Streptomyces triticagri]
MGMGASLVMLAVGAILALAVDWQIEGVDLDIVGLIMMAVGLIGVCAYVSIFKRRRMQAPPPAAPVVEQEHRYRDRPYYE